MKAVVVQELNRMSVEQVELEGPKADEVRLKMAAVGVCHSDLSVLNGTVPHPLPVVLGHEGAGVVEAVGPGVSHVKPGDHVVMSFVPNCGRCFHCVRNEAFLCRATRGGMMLDGTSRLRLGDKPLSAFCSLGNMAEYVVCPSISVVPIDKDVPLRVAALIGCGVATGVGAAINTAKVQPGSTVAVYGCGGIGLSVIQGARIAGAARIIAVDVSDEKLELAKRFGATDVIQASAGPKALIALTPEGVGVDYAFEAIGKGEVVETALTVTRRGGHAVAIGLGRVTDTIKLNALVFPAVAKTLSGCMFGSCNPKHDFPKLLDLYRAGRLELEGMVTKTYSIDDAPKAFEDLEKGVNARGVIAFD